MSEINNPMPRRLNLLSLASRWKMDASVAHYRFCDFIKDDHLLVFTDYSGFGRMGLLDDEKYYSFADRGLVWSDVDDDWYSKGQISEIDEYEKLKKHSQRFCIGRVENDLSEKEKKRLKELRARCQSIEDSRSFDSVVPINGRVYIWDVVPCSDGIVINGVLPNSEPEGHHDAHLYLIEKTGKGQDAKYKNQYLKKDLSELYVLKHDLLSFEQNVLGVNHGLKKEKSTKTPKNEQRTIKFKRWLVEKGGRDNVRDMTRAEIWKDLKGIDPELFRAGMDGFFKHIKRLKLIDLKEGRRQDIKKPH